MTGPVTTEALVAELAECLEENDHRSRYQQARALLAGPLAPLLAALQQVTAERDEYGEYIIDLECQATRDKAELARLRAEGEALKADRDDAIRMLDVWFDTSTKTNEQVVPQLVDALVGYLRTCRCGGMPAETSDMIEAGAADFIRRRAGYIIAPVIEAMVAERTASLRAEGEAKDRALQDALKAAIRAWSAKLHIPVTRMMSRELRAEFSTALARAATAREGA